MATKWRPEDDEINEEEEEEDVTVCHSSVAPAPAQLNSTTKFLLDLGVSFTPSNTITDFTRDTKTKKMLSSSQSMSLTACSLNTITIHKTSRPPPCAPLYNVPTPFSKSGLSPTPTI
jgi:hypothetical protein